MTTAAVRLTRLPALSRVVAAIRAEALAFACFHGVHELTEHAGPCGRCVGLFRGQKSP